MIAEVPVAFPHSLDRYAEYALLAPSVHALRSEAELLVPKLQGRTVWMINSTARGGGVAEMLPKLVHLLRQLGVNTRWYTVNPTEPAFFTLTKRLHNAIHGVPCGDFGPKDRELFDSVSQRLYESFAPLIATNDIVVVHDPQPAGVGALLKQRSGVKTIWRCHIGLDHDTESTRRAWKFLQAPLQSYDHAVFSAPAYIVPALARRVSLICPSIDPLSHKNRPLHPVKLAGVLHNAGLLSTPHPIMTPRFSAPVSRLTPDGDFRPLDGATEIGVLFRPVMTQVSRWDRLKGWFPLLLGFRQLKQNAERLAGNDQRARKRLSLTRLVLAGPEPSAISDDPEAEGVLEEIRREYLALSPELQQDVAVLSLPMTSLKRNALMVNALQRASSVVVQNSLREGFGLSVTEAMWKHTPVLGSSAYGIRQQISPGIDGELIDDPAHPASVCEGMARMLADPKRREHLARNAHYRVTDEFLIFRQLSDWLRLLAQV